MREVNVLLYENFTTLDAVGPVEVLSKLDKEFKIKLISIKGGVVKGSGNINLLTDSVDQIEHNDILLIPGGLGARTLVNDKQFIDILKTLALKSSFVMTVCTGSALLAKTGLLKGIKATSNKMAWDWVVTQGPDVNWIKKARWVTDGKYYSSSGITAGIDMALGFVSDQINVNIAEKISSALEHIWIKEKDNDPFTK